jgi:hypothetical protein
MEMRRTVAVVAVALLPHRDLQQVRWESRSQCTKLQLLEVGLNELRE